MRASLTVAEGRGGPRRSTAKCTQLPAHRITQFLAVVTKPERSSSGSVMFVHSLTRGLWLNVAIRSSACDATLPPGQQFRCPAAASWRAQEWS